MRVLRRDDAHHGGGGGDDSGGSGGAGDDAPTWTQVAGCDDCGDCVMSTRADLNTGPPPAGEYLVVVEGYGFSEGRFDLRTECTSVCGGHLDALAGGVCAGYLTCGATVRGDTASAPATSWGNATPDHFYRFELNGDVDNHVFGSCASDSTCTCAC